MFASKINTATMAVFALCIIAPIAQAGITTDPSQKIPKTLGKGEGAIFVVGDANSIAISAVHQTPETTAICHGTSDGKTQTYQGPCYLVTKDQRQVFHAQCTKGNGSASIFFQKSGEPGNAVVVQAVNGMSASFSQNEALKQGTISSTVDGTQVILSCGN